MCPILSPDSGKTTFVLRSEKVGFGIKSCVIQCSLCILMISHAFSQKVKGGENAGDNFGEINKGHPSVNLNSFVSAACNVFVSLNIPGGGNQI